MQKQVTEIRCPGTIFRLFHAHKVKHELLKIKQSSLLQQQRLRVCEVCSSYLENFEGLHDNDKRLADHYGGKLHIGFIDLR